MAQRNKYLVVVAGGSGLRMGSETPKQFLELGGKAILVRTIERFLQAEPDIKVVTVIPRNSLTMWKNLCELHALNVPQIVVPGGMTRYHSVSAALAHIPDDAVVAIHDGVRPLVSVRLIREMFDRMSSCRALVPVIPVVDTLKNKDPEGPDPDRSRLVAAQTPQMFISRDIKAAYEALGFRLEFTDDASVAKAYKIPLSFVDGERSNIKITTPEDLRIAELFV